eukprot:TRINITY_DN6189_c0_g1_i1.p1 TRINITY_DN6189_c0_g1~~TRINITY_DN6189_c0_g1_i1.p1  ORF type:complete len:804 (+),score=220.54 TRINITY_DN6189_c0_g1_i1:228-2639(+)
MTGGSKPADDLGDGGARLMLPPRHDRAQADAPAPVYTNPGAARGRAKLTRPNGHTALIPSPASAFTAASAQRARPPQAPQWACGRPALALSTGLPALLRLCNPQLELLRAEHVPRRVLTDPSEPAANGGLDNVEHDLIVHAGQHLVDKSSGQRYRVRGVLGKGTFAQVLSATEEETGARVALKVVKSVDAYRMEARKEVEVLRFLRQRVSDEGARAHIVEMLGLFEDCRHVCIVFEQLHVSLFELIKENDYRGLSLRTVRLIVRQITTTVRAIHDAGVFHCDIKPENVLIAAPNSAKVKLVDFGSACRFGRSSRLYVQSRFYRAPEVFLQRTPGPAIDMWSLGCVAAELFLGLPLFPGSDDYSMVYRITEMQGYPPPALLQRCGHQRFFKFVGDAGAGEDDAARPKQPPADGAHVGPPQLMPSGGWILRGETEFYSSHQRAPPPFKRYFNYSRLSDIVTRYAWPGSILREQDPAAKRALMESEKGSRECFVDYLDGLLNTDPEQRWTASLACRHPFICPDATFLSKGAFDSDVAMPELQQAKLQRQLSQQQRVMAPGSTPTSAGMGGLLGASPGMMLGLGTPADPSFGGFSGPHSPAIQLSVSLGMLGGGLQGFGGMGGSVPHSAATPIPVPRQDSGVASSLPRSVGGSGAIPVAVGGTLGMQMGGIPIPMVGQTPTMGMESFIQQAQSVGTSVGEMHGPRAGMWPAHGAAGVSSSPPNLDPWLAGGQQGLLGLAGASPAGGLPRPPWPGFGTPQMQFAPPATSPPLGQPAPAASSETAGVFYPPGEFDDGDAIVPGWEEGPS